ncbi:glycosyltransferase sugar-binding region containing DXD motif domain-containing protein [Sarocladium implicatum]|nr:glycosyltransferase sugar-binding region containing DXD motif domain-containing protein [Sarocladium implicatum]
MSCLPGSHASLTSTATSPNLSLDHIHNYPPSTTSQPSHTQHIPSKDDPSPKLTVSNLFPSKIWQSWKDDSEDPTERTKGFPRTWRTINPSWSYERITDAAMNDFVTSRFQSPISTTFTNLTDPILKADFLRYLILLHEGGVWADIDVLPHQPMDDWIPEEYRSDVNLVIGIENDHHKQPIWPKSPYSVQLCQYTVLAKPNHPALKTLVDQVTHGLETLLSNKKPGQAVTFAEVMGTTGPFAFTKALMDYFTEQTGVEHTGDELDRLEEPRLIGDVLVLPKDSFGWLPQEHTHEEGDPMILVEHLFIGSWRDGHPG